MASLAGLGSTDKGDNTPETADIRLEQPFRHFINSKQRVLTVSFMEIGKGECDRAKKILKRYPRCLPSLK